jgi:hypothetical protein
MDLAALKQVLALPEHDRSCSMEIAVSRSLTWVRCGTRAARSSAGTPAGDELA